MTGSKLKLSIVTPERKVLECDCDEVSVPGAKGEFGVLPGHAPFLAFLGIGALSYRIGPKSGRLVIRGGLAEVLDDRVNILADLAELPREIDTAAAASAEQEALDRLKTASGEAVRATVDEVFLNAARRSVASGN